MGNCPYTDTDPDDLYPEWRLRPMVMGFLSVTSYCVKKTLNSIV